MADFDQMMAVIPEDGEYHTHSTVMTPGGEWNILIYTMPDGTYHAVLFREEEVVYP